VVKVIVLYAGILAVLIAVPRWARSLPDARRGRIVVGLAVSSAILGWAALAYTVWGQSYQGFEMTLDSSGQTSPRATSASLLELGLDPRLAALIFALALSFATLVVGTLGHVATRRLGRWLMIASLVVPVTVGSLSWGFAGLVPAVIVAVAATRLAFTRPTQHPAATVHEPSS